MKMLSSGIVGLNRSFCTVASIVSLVVQLQHLSVIFFDGNVHKQNHTVVNSAV